MANGSRIPHSLRIVILFLRLAVGLDFFYLGFTALWNPTLGQALSTRSLGDLYAWLGVGGTGATLTSFQTYLAWAFLVIGGALLIGFLLRFMAIVGIGLTLFGYWPALTHSAFGISQLVNDEILLVVCLLVLIFANAGTYLGVDKFVSIRKAFSQKP